MSRKFLLLFIVVCAAAFADTEASATRGQEILHAKGCTGCHAIAGEGATVTASSLSRPINREYTPAGFAATLWNHAPQMFAAIRKERGSIPQVSQAEATDLFAYFASLGYFEPMGEASRGARLIHSKKCAECHFSGGPGSLIETWTSLRDPMELAASMWNHQPRMQAAMSQRGIRQPSLASQDLSDIVVYLRGLPKQRKAQVAMMQMPSLEGAEKLLESNGCTKCHVRELGFDRIVRDQSLTDIAAAMWNHGAQMTSAVRTIPPEDLRTLVGWIWTRQIVEPGGNAGRGERLARQRKCLDCHAPGGLGPAFASLPQPYTVVHATSALWKHGPVMMAAMQEKGFRWPRFSAQDVDDLLAFISSQKKTVAEAR